jgi:hypothetical protein
MAVCKQQSTFPLFIIFTLNILTSLSHRLSIPLQGCKFFSTNPFAVSRIFNKFAAKKKEFLPAGVSL